MRPALLRGMAWRSARGARAGLILLLLMASHVLQAAAHQRLVRAEPAAEEVAAAVPRELRLSFSEPVELAFTRLELIGPAGESIPLGRAALAPDSSTVLVVPIGAVLGAGGHTVRWSTASRDGHPVRGEYRFTIGADAEGLDAADGGSPAELGQGPLPLPPPGAGVPEREFTAESPAYVMVRWANYLGIVGVLGASSFALLVLGLVRRRTAGGEQELIAPARRRAAGVGLAFAAVLLLTAVARLYAQSLALHGAGGAGSVDRIGSLLGGTLWGWGWLLGGGAAALAALGFALAHGGRSGGWVLASLAGVGVALSAALSGHAASGSGALGASAIAADALHILAAGGWLGSLLVLLVAGIPAAARMASDRRSAAVAALVRAFSPTALVFAALLILTGIFATLIHVGSVSALISSRYGTLLLIKLGIFLILIGTGAYNYLRVRPALGNDAATARLRRSAGLEIAVAAAVLLVTAMLVATPRPIDLTPDEIAEVDAGPAERM